MWHQWAASAVMLVTAFWQAHICTWRTLYLASVQYSVSLQNNYDLCSHKDGARKSMNRRRQDLKFYYTTYSTWSLHSLCTHMPWMLNTSSFRMLWLIILQHSRLKSSFRGSSMFGWLWSFKCLPWSPLCLPWCHWKQDDTRSTAEWEWTLQLCGSLADVCR